MTELSTDRLLLRQWRDSDREPFAVMNADPAVMEHFPALQTREMSDALIDRNIPEIDGRGWGLWALEVRDTGESSASPGCRCRASRRTSCRRSRSAGG